MNQHSQDAPYTPPREYQHVLRGPRFSWWRSLLVFALTMAFVILGVVLIACVLVATGRQMPRIGTASDQTSIFVFALTNLLLAMLIPATMLSMRIVHGVNPGYLSSVAGGLRWRWMWRCAVVTVPVFLVWAGIDLLIDWPDKPRPDQWGLLLVLVLVGTPLQAAGEEYIARGLIQQHIGAWFRNPRVAMVVAMTYSTMLFAAAHGSTDPWIFLDLSIFGAACSFLVWRTGGLEAAIVLHAASNMTGMATSIVFGGWGEGFVQSGSKGDPLDPLITLMVTGIVVVLLLRQARRQGVQRTVESAAAAPASGSEVSVRRAPIFTVPRVAVASVVLALNLGAAYSGMPRKSEGLRQLRYIDVAGPFGVSMNGCLQGRFVDSLPLEIRRYRTGELVEDDVRLTLGDLSIPGSSGIFLLPVSAELMTENPKFRVVQPDGKSIDYRYKFASGALQSRGICRPRG